MDIGKLLFSFKYSGQISSICVKNSTFLEIHAKDLNNFLLFCNVSYVKCLIVVVISSPVSELSQGFQCHLKGSDFKPISQIQDEVSQATRFASSSFRFSITTASKFSLVIDKNSVIRS